MRLRASQGHHFTPRRCPHKGRLRGCKLRFHDTCKCAKPRHGNTELLIETAKLGKTYYMWFTGCDALMRCFFFQTYQFKRTSQKYHGNTFFEKKAPTSLGVFDVAVARRTDEPNHEVLSGRVHVRHYDVIGRQLHPPSFLNLKNNSSCQPVVGGGGGRCLDSDGRKCYDRILKGSVRRIWWHLVVRK